MASLSTRLALSLGVALCIGLALWQDTGAIVDALRAVGWGALAVVAFHLVPMAADTWAWRHLLPAGARPRFASLLWMRWVGEAVNGLLPAAQIGGDILRGRLVAARGVPGAAAGASIVVDLTLSIVTLFLFTAFGVALVMFGMGDVPHAGLLASAAGGLAVVVALVALQHAGLFERLARLAVLPFGGDAWQGLVAGGGALDRAVSHLYRQRLPLAASACWALFAWLAGAGEIWLALYFLGVPLGPIEALVLESLTQAVRSAVFPVPGALGIQEGGFLAVGLLLGLPAEIALATALLRRLRELAFGIPGLLSWRLAGRRPAC